jgi:eukaryotic-like serine/threonine-protein kinase
VAVSSRRDHDTIGGGSIAQRHSAAPERGRGRGRGSRKRLKDRYTLGDVLGHGSLGTTYRAFDEVMQRPVAIKLLSERYADDSQFRERFMSAVAAAGRLNHPHIVKVLDAGLVDGRPFVVTELVEGQSLRALLAQGTSISTQHCVEIAQAVADATAYAHRQRVLHGDIRPENVLLDARGKAKVADFGFVRAALATNMTLLGSVSDRVAYTPPDQLAGATKDERTDVYAVGMLAYELLTGTQAAEAAGSAGSALAWRQPANGRGVPPSPRRARPDLPGYVERSVMRAISLDAQQRIISAEELGLALAGREPVTAPVEHAVPVSWRTDTRRRAGRGSRGFGYSAAALIPILASAAIFVAAFVTLTGVFPRIFGTFQMTDVPGLIDYDVSEATSIATAHGLTVKVAGTQPTDDRPKGAVLGQDPQAGGRLRKGSEIKLTVSEGIRPPDVSGKPVDEARAILVRTGWTVAGVETKGDSSAPSGTVVSSRPGPDQPAADKSEGITLLVSAGNLAVRRPLVLGTGTPGPAEMVDGDPDTVGKLGASAPTWVEIELAQPSAMASVELVTAQERPSVTIHEVWVWTADNQFRGMHTFVGPTEDNQTLSIRFDQPVRNVRAVRIATTQADGAVGWREIRVFDR